MLTRLFVCGYKSMRMLKAISMSLLSKNNTYNIVNVVFCFRERNTRSLKKATNSRAWSMMLADIVMLEYIWIWYRLYVSENKGVRYHFHEHIEIGGSSVFFRYLKLRVSRRENYVHVLLSAIWVYSLCHWLAVMVCRPLSYAFS